MITDSVKSEGFEMRYIRFGDESAPPMVILPGLSIVSVLLSAAAVEKQFSSFADKFDIYLFDRRSDPPEDYTIAQMAEDTAEAMKLLGIESTCMYGVSQGGMIAQAIALSHPELVCCMVLASTASCAPKSLCGLAAEWRELAEKGDTEGLMHSFGRNVYSPESYEAYKDAFSAAAKAVTGEDLRKFLIFSKDLSDESLDLSGKLGCPLLVLGSENDKVIEPAAVKELAKQHGAMSYIYKGYSHAVYDEAPDFLSKVLGFFLDMAP